MADQTGPRRVVIVGGGFAGLFAARALRRAPVQVTLIDRAEHCVFQPLRDRHPVGGEDRLPAARPAQKRENAEFVLAEVTGIDAAGQRVNDEQAAEIGFHD